MASVKIMNGPNRDQIFPLRGGELVGRDPGNAIQVFAPGVSRRHFQFSVEGGQVFVTDLGSSNGTYVNNNRITKHLLIENDTITVGGINLRFTKGDGTNLVADPIGTGSNPVNNALPGAAIGTPQGPPSRKLSFSQEEVPVGAFGSMPGTTPMGAPEAHPGQSASQVVLKDDQEEAGGAEDYSLDASIVFSAADTKLPQKDQVSALQKRLQLMFEISQALGAITARDELLGKIMDKLFEIFPQADRGFIIVGESVENLQPAVVRNKKSGSTDEVQISRTIARKVYGEKQAILSQNAMEDDRFSGGLSILNFRILSMMVAPLLYRNEVFGFIHLDTQDRVKKFTPDDLNLLAGIASNAAIFLKNLNLFDEIKKETEARANLQRYFSPELAKKMVSGEIDLKLGGQLANGTVFFSDIVGFTSMSESMAPDAVVEKINKYFKYMVDIVFKYNGSIDKFMGDAIMAIWGVPVTLKEEAVLAITAGVEMQNAVFLLNSDFIKEGEKELHMGIGLNSGHFTAGNMGSEKRMEYTCIGDNVNLAQRVESKAGRGHIFVADTTYERAKSKVLAVKLKQTKVKGKANAITIYSVRGVATTSRDAALYITSLPFRTGPENDASEGLIIKAKLLGDNLILGLCLLRELPKGDKCEIHLNVPEMPKCKVMFDVQGEVPIQSG
ncbi:MAG: adenylate/guanylate cyclase domain-containing protein, partial [Planctomycetota bacterium]